MQKYVDKYTSHIQFSVLYVNMFLIYIRYNVLIIIVNYCKYISTTDLGGNSANLLTLAWQGLMGEQN